MKKCIKCHEIKPRTNEYFSNAKGNSDGLNGYCKDCKRIISVKWRKEKGAEYSTWGNMKARCRDVKFPGYKNYGGRGIKVCKRWRDSFDLFLLDMGKKPSSKHSIERIDNDKGYFPSNCKWATDKEQALNKRNYKKRIDNTSGVSGVSWREDHNSYRVRIGAKGKTINIGEFKTINDAIEARKEAEIKYW